MSWYRTLLITLSASIALLSAQASAYDNASVFSPGQLGAEIVNRDEQDMRFIRTEEKSGRGQEPADHGSE